MKIKSPKYKIGDIVIYPDRYWKKEDNSVREIYQSKIIEAYALIETNDPDAEGGWLYTTERSNKDGEDSIFEADILYKL